MTFSGCWSCTDRNNNRNDKNKQLAKINFSVMSCIFLFYLIKLTKLKTDILLTCFLYI